MATDIPNLKEATQGLIDEMLSVYGPLMRELLEDAGYDLEAATKGLRAFAENDEELAYRALEITMASIGDAIIREREKELDVDE
jgi:hypothetical protein